MGGSSSGRPLSTILYFLLVIVVVLSNVGPYINSVVLCDELAFSLPPLQRIVRLLNNQKKNARS